MFNPVKAAEAFPDTESSGDTYQQEDGKRKPIKQPTKWIRCRGEVGVPKQGGISASTQCGQVKGGKNQKSGQEPTAIYRGSGHVDGGGDATNNMIRNYTPGRPQMSNL